MATLIAQCPHCNTKQIALTVVFAIPIHDSAGFVYLHCPNCNLPSCARVDGDNESRSFSNASKQNTTFNSERFHIDQMWPEQRKPNIPDSLPLNVARAMYQAESTFSQKDHEEASSVMYRKALELGLREIDPALTGMLAAKIEALGKKGHLTASLVDWARQIKNLGNDGAHESEPITQAELAQLRGLTDMVLQYLFTLPAIVEARRKESAKETNS